MVLADTAYSCNIEKSNTEFSAVYYTALTVFSVYNRGKHMINYKVRPTKMRVGSGNNETSGLLISLCECVSYIKTVRC